MSDPRGYVLVALDAVLKKAYSAKNLVKGAWLSMSDAELRERIREEVKELMAEVDGVGSHYEILLEAADILAFAAMLGDPNRGDPLASHPARYRLEEVRS